MASNSSQRKRLIPNTDIGWDKTVPVAIGPNWLRSKRFKAINTRGSVGSEAVQAFNQYMRAVEKWRKPKDCKTKKGTRSLQETALEYVIGAMPWIEEGIEELPRILIERLWGEFNRRLVSPRLL
jgi:hypothetical protein